MLIAKILVCLGVGAIVVLLSVLYGAINRILEEEKRHGPDD